METESTYVDPTCEIVEVCLPSSLTVTARHDEEESAETVKDVELHRSCQFWPVSVYLLRWHAHLMRLERDSELPVSLVDVGCGNGISSLVARRERWCDDVLLLDRTIQSWRQTQILNAGIDVDYADFKFYWFDWGIRNDMERLIDMHPNEFSNLRRKYMLMASDIFYEVDNFPNIIRNLKFAMAFWNSREIKYDCYVAYVFRCDEDTFSLLNNLEEENVTVEIISCSDESTKKKFFEFIDLVQQKLLSDRIYVRRKKMLKNGIKLTVPFEVPPLLMEDQLDSRELFDKMSILRKNRKINREPFEYMRATPHGEFSRFTQVDTSQFYILKLSTNEKLPIY